MFFNKIFKKKVDTSPIYLITTATEFTKDTLYSNDRNVFKGLRTVGYRHNLKDAQETVEENMCDIWETIYDYAIIEEVYPELYPTVEHKWYYKWDTVFKKYKPYTITNDYEEYTSLAIG